MEIRLFFALSPSLFFSATSFATTLENTRTLDPLVVTASQNQLEISNPTKLKNHITLEDKTQIPQNLSDLISSTPGVSQNGQGGHFQNFSIRGVSKHRIKTLVNGIKIEGVRRAGASVSFVEPLLIGNAAVWRTPASTLFGSGALGGAVKIETKQFMTPTIFTGYNSEGDENYQVFGTGEENWSFGIARRDANNTTTKDGSKLNTHFSQYSAVFSAKAKVSNLDLDFFALPAIAENIGKSNTDFPLRETNYPREKHLLAKLDITSSAGWKAKIYIHPNDLKTEVLKVNSSFNTVSNEAFDFGGSWQLEKQLGGFNSLLGIDYSARRSVNTQETSLDLATNNTSLSSPLRQGKENEISLFTTFNWMLGSAEMQAGTRLSYFDQSAKNIKSQDDNAWAGFINLLYPFENGLDLTANIASAYRYPTLSERFFTGTTGRGNVISNANLKKEQSINLDIGIGWVGNNYSIGSHVYYLHIRDYIERVEISNDVLTFVNLNNGTITGFELEGNYFIDEQWSLNWAGHILRGEDENGDAISDIPSNRMLFGLSHQAGKWQSLINFEYRTHKNNPGNGEKKIPSANLLSTAIRYQVNQQLQLSLSANNLFDEEYFASADKKASYAPRRSFGINLSWKMK